MVTRRSYTKRTVNQGWFPPGVSQNAGAQNPNWQGDQVSYKGLHLWVSRNKTKPGGCEHCGTTERRLEWANKSREYRRDLDDWMALCRRCHQAYDKSHPTAASRIYGRPGPNGHEGGRGDRW